MFPRPLRQTKTGEFACKYGVSEFGTFCDPSGGQTRFRPMLQGEIRSVSSRSFLLACTTLDHIFLDDLEPHSNAASYALRNTPPRFICTRSVAKQKKNYLLTGLQASFSS